MSYEVTATRKRPSSFDLLAGQEFVVATLKNAIKTGRIAHSFLFSGPRGVGKTSAARILAKSLNCVRGPTPEPCGVCPSCVEISRGGALDVIEIDGASNTSVNDVRQIKDEVLFAPNSSRYKVYIIDEVHMLSNSAFNALLKTIEEPPPYIVFIFATTEIHKVPATIRSRCQQFNFRLIPLDTIKSLLRSVCGEMNISAEDDALLWIAKEATGSLRDAYTLLDQVVSFSAGGITMAGIRDKLGLVGLDRMNEFADLLADGRARESLAILDDILASGVSIEQFATDLTEYFRNLLFLQHDVKKESVLGYSPERFSRKAVRTFQPRQTEKALSLLLELYRNLRYSLNQRFEMELAVSRLADLKNHLTKEELFGRLETLRRELRAGVVAGAPRQEDAALGETSSDEGGDESAGAPQETAPEAPAADSGAVPRDKKDALLVSLRKKKLALSSALEKATAWRLEGDVLEISFDDKFSADFVTQDMSSVAPHAREVFGADVRISVKIRKENKAAEPAVEPEKPEDDDRVEIAKKVFRGEVLK